MDYNAANLKSYIGSEYELNYIIKVINKIRKENNLPELKINTKLNDSASKKAQDMVDRNYWSHKDPDGKMSWDLIKNSGYKYKKAGEDMAMDLDNINSVEKWVASPTHLENILDPDFKEVGLGNVGKYKVLHFGLSK